MTMARTSTEADDVGLNVNVLVAEAGAGEDLQENQAGVERRDRMNRGRALVLILREIFHPPTTGEEGDADQDDEHEFGGTGVHDREPVVQQLDDGEATEDALKDRPVHSAKKPRRFEPGALFVFPEQAGQDDDEHAENGGDDAVRVLVEGSAREHAKWREPAAEARWANRRQRAAASLEVTRAPAVRSRTVQHTTKIENL